MEFSQRTARSSDEKTKVKTQSKAAVVDNSPSKRDELKDLKELVSGLTSSVKTMQTEMTNMCKGLSTKSLSGQPSSRSYRGQSYRGRGRGKYQSSSYPQGQSQNKEKNSEVTCWRCGQPGHVKLGCRAKLAPKGLNGTGPATQGQQ